MTVKQLIINAISAYDPTLDLTDSSSLTDLLINPGSAFFDPTISQLNFLLNNLGLQDPVNMSTDEVDAILSNFLIPRNAGSNASGYVELLYLVPQSVTIPPGTIFSTSDGVQFQNTQTIYVPLNVVQSNAWNYPYYSSGPVPVTAVLPGANGIISPGIINSTTLTDAPSRVTNPAAFAGGSDTESNTDYVARVLTEVISGALGSAASITSTLLKTYPTIENVQVRGMGDPEMLRDIVASGVQEYGQNILIDYYGKVSGLNDLPYPESQAYYGVFYDDPATSGIQPDLPLLTEFTSEFTTDQYSGIYKLSNAGGTTIQTLNVLNDNFNAAIIDSRWVQSDSTTGVGRLMKPDEVALDTRNGVQKLRLGDRITENVIDTTATTLNYNWLYRLLNNFRTVNSMGPQVSVGQPTVGTYTDLPAVVAWLNSSQFLNYVDRPGGPGEGYKVILLDIINQISPASAQNFYPVFTTPLALNNGITITGTLETDDDTTDGRMSYVTVLRDPSSADPANGYGFAWMKGNGTAYNVYLVDNSILADDLFINPSFIVNPPGDNAWKAAAKVVINQSTDPLPAVYNFELVINIDYAMQLRIWAVGNSRPVSPTMYCGAPLDGPVASGSNIGFGVLGTSNARWWYDDILVQTSNGVHTAALFKLKARTTNFPNNSNVTLQYYGYGNDTNGNYGLTLFLYQQVNNVWTWVQIGTNTSTSATSKNLTLIQDTFTINGNYRDVNNDINLLATTTYAANAVTDVTTYYVDLETTVPSGVHTGGCADIYVNDPTQVVVATNTINNINGIIDMSPANGFYDPVHSIISISTALVGNTLTENTDWNLNSISPAYAYSMQEYPYLEFNPQWLNYKMNIVYRYYQNGAAVQALVSSPSNRFGGTSNLAKVIPPTVVTINQFAYRGSITVAAFTLLVQNYINSSIATISLNDILNLAYQNTISYIDLSNVDIEITAYDYLRNISDPVPLTTSYTLNGITAFFADSTSLSGIQRL